jgi:hypothetical protein
MENQNPTPHQNFYLVGSEETQPAQGCFIAKG